MAYTMVTAVCFEGVYRVGGGRASSVSLVEFTAVVDHISCNEIGCQQLWSLTTTNVHCVKAVVAASR